MYSKANNMKINVDTSRTQNARRAMVYDVKNCNKPVNTMDAINQPNVDASVGTTKKFLS